MTTISGANARFAARIFIGFILCLTLTGIAHAVNNADEVATLTHVADAAADPEITDLTARIASGDLAAAEQLIPLITGKVGRLRHVSANNLSLICDGFQRMALNPNPKALLLYGKLLAWDRCVGGRPQSAYVYLSVYYLNVEKGDQVQTVNTLQRIADKLSPRERSDADVLVTQMLRGERPLRFESDNVAALASAEAPPSFEPKTPQPVQPQTSLTPIAATAPADTLTPADKIAAPEIENSSAHTYVVQVGSAKTDEDAQKIISWAQQQAQDLLKDAAFSIVSVDLPGKGLWYRVHVGSWGQAAEAGAFCAQLKQGQVDCFVLKM